MLSQTAGVEEEASGNSGQDAALASASPEWLVCNKVLEQVEAPPWGYSPGQRAVPGPQTHAELVLPSERPGEIAGQVQLGEAEAGPGSEQFVGSI